MLQEVSNKQRYIADCKKMERDINHLKEALSKEKKQNENGTEKKKLPSDSEEGSQVCTE